MTTPFLSVSGSSPRFDLRLLQDSVLPQNLVNEVSGGIHLERWDEGEASDIDLVRAAVARGCRGVLLYGRHALDQPGLRREAKQSGIALVAVEAADPIEAKQRILRNEEALRRKLADYDCLLVLAGEVRPLDE